MGALSRTPLWRPYTKQRDNHRDNASMMTPTMFVGGEHVPLFHPIFK